jgi:isoprenylcysteine carboxyl methyltransferase (ICMT) family protein YpbQ
MQLVTAIYAYCVNQTNLSTLARLWGIEMLIQTHFTLASFYGCLKRPNYFYVNWSLQHFSI